MAGRAVVCQGLCDLVGRYGNGCDLLARADQTRGGHTHVQNVEGIRRMYLKGGSTRRMGVVLQVLRGAGVSASTVSRLTRALDAQLRRFQSGPIEERYCLLMLDGVYLPFEKAEGGERLELAD